MIYNASGANSEVSQVEARSILEALKRGGVPIEKAQYLAVGRGEWLSSVREDLNFIATGGAKPRLIVAPYGGGKTHFLSLISNIALKENFVVSYVELQSREAPFDRFETIFGKIMRQVRTCDGQGIQYIFDKWANTFPYYSVQEIENALSTISRSIDFRRALRSYLDLSTISSPDSLKRRQDIITWLFGDPLPAPIMKEIGIRNRVTIANVSEIMTSFLGLLRSAKYSGLVLLLDEAEAITSLSQSQKREGANQNLRKLLDNTDDNHGLYIIFATTPKFLEDPIHGARSYPALWDRIRTLMILPKGLASKRSMLMVLEPLNEGNLIELAKKVVSIHAIAWCWEAEKVVSEAITVDYVKQYKKNNPTGPVRPFLRTLIDILDIMQQSDGSFDIRSTIPELSFGDE